MRRRLPDPEAPPATAERPDALPDPEVSQRVDPEIKVSMLRMLAQVLRMCAQEAAARLEDRQGRSTARRRVEELRSLLQV